jgi:murein DD-endopeptidase MepM/ murein hydrolase activator NlpD
MGRLALSCVLVAGCAAPIVEQPRSTLVELPVELPSEPSVAAEPLLAWPVRAAITSPFGPRDGRAHEGLDLAVPDGTPVVAAADGQVSYASSKMRGYGHAVIVRHAGGIETLYAHNQELLVAEGAAVRRGQLIARSGHSGRVTAPHLHFEVRKDGRAVDPVPLLDSGRE